MKEPLTRGTFEQTVYAAELKEIAASREQRGLDPCPKEGPPSTRHGLIGLSLSGGGIRSATFSLGVIQGLIRKGTFRHIDYLSTVSGGGYLGACLSSLLKDRNASEKDLQNTEGTSDTQVVNHLRNTGNYLSSGKLIEQVRLPMIALRGVLLNILPLLTCLIGAVFLTECLMELWHMTGAHSVRPVIISCIFLVPVLTYPLLFRLFRSSFNWKRRNHYELFLSFTLALTLAVLAAIPVMSLVRICVDSTWEGQLRRYLNSQPIEREYIQIGLVILALGLFCIVGLFLTKLSKFSKVLIGFLIAVVGPALVFGAYLLCCIFFIESPYFDKGYTVVLNSQTQDYTKTYDWDSLITVLRGKGFHFQGNHLDQPWTITTNTTSRGFSWNLAYKDPDKGASTITIETANSYLFIPERSIMRGNAVWGFYGVGLCLFLYSFFFMDVNITSLNGFYRDRLSKAFLIRRTPEGNLEANDGQKLSDLSRPGNAAPYHLINATLNLAGSEDLALRGRHADFFLFSKNYSGSPSTGYAPTVEFEKRDPQLNLATAMAISAAAAAPNMGRITNRFYVFVLTMFNIRLGYWAPNPKRMGAGVWLRRLLWPYVGPLYLFRETFSLLTTRATCVNLSDGGHLENLGLYQLLKRHCKLIIAVDAEADPEMLCSGLVELVRLARIDLGIVIDIKLDDLRPLNQSLSKKHGVLATIDYGPGEEPGQLLYLKSSMTGDENEYIKAHKREFPTFPHRPTSDQFFNESQFEVYRALGEHIALHTLNDLKNLEQIPTA